MEEISVKTHLIITDIHDEYHMNWYGKIAEANPLLKNGLPVFTIIGSKGRVEVNTIDINYLEKIAKLLTCPKGRAAITVDTSRIYIQEVGGNLMPLGILTHQKVKTFAPMYDKIKYV